MALLDIFRTRFLRLLTILVVSLTGILGGLLASARGAQPTPACIIFNRGGSSDLFQLNVGTGTVGLYRPGFDTDFAHHAGDDSVNYSPDGRYFIYLDEQSQVVELVNASTHALRPMAQNGPPTGISYDWAPDSRNVAYISQDSSGDVTFALMNPDNGEKRNMHLGSYPNDPVYLAGWSADGEYVAYVSGLYAGGSAGNTGQYRFVSLHDWKILPTTIEAFVDTYVTEAPQELVQPVWSPKGHNFAYITAGPDDFSLTIATPENGPKQTVPLMTRTSNYFTNIHWSADGRYVEAGLFGLEDTDDDPAWADDGFWHVYFLGVDGTAQPNVLRENIIGGEARASEGWWSADGRAWVYWYSFNIQGLDEDYPTGFSYLMAYYPDERRFEMLTSDVSGEVFPRPTANGKVFVVQTGLNAKSQKIVLVTTDGKKPLTILEDARDMGWGDLIVWDKVEAIGMRVNTSDGQKVSWAWADGSGRQMLSKESFAKNEGDGNSVDSWIEVVPSPTGQKVAAIFADGPE